ncbi:MAG TPA: ATP synthase F1 subunit delta [Candidatus Sphingobacterium stercoripullorum]|uniref:ATP synthase subunit delta n=1 Tax=Candidatus Sphingobacterium stercoripullorum TaxID=2838759 RepID=A0A9D1W868_9SPHI|nr:ATP synthase F1 subunit delta [Candidatus Sphingobacterium stercoripullorum]HLR50206.1 ATP synthase F1 subunit delta [Candidatus Sphingobacterium stercoripullorum]
MSSYRVATRYAKALIDSAEQQSKLETVKEDMQGVAKLFKQNSSLQYTLANPIIGPDKKQQIIKALLSGKVDNLVIDFFLLLIRKGRGNVIVDTTNEFLNSYRSQQGIVQATVRSAESLSEEEMNKLRSKLQSETGLIVELTNIVDPSLIAGFVIQVGDIRLNNSIAGKLNRLERHFQQQGV